MLTLYGSDVQTLGARFTSDGRWQGQESVQTIQCDQANNACQVRVPAPGAALVFFSDDAQNAASEPGASTFPTTAVTKTKNTVTIAASVLATSNGDSGKVRLSNKGGTSQGGTSGAVVIGVPSITVLVTLFAGMAAFYRVRL